MPFRYQARAVCVAAGQVIIAAVKCRGLVQQPGDFGLPRPALLGEQQALGFQFVGAGQDRGTLRDAQLLAGLSQRARDDLAVGTQPGNLGARLLWRLAGQGRAQQFGGGLGQRGGLGAGRLVRAALQARDGTFNFGDMRGAFLRRALRMLVVRLRLDLVRLDLSGKSIVSPRRASAHATQG